MDLFDARKFIGVYEVERGLADEIFRFKTWQKYIRHHDQIIFGAHQAGL